ncbi:metal ABC transporter ATP-binding protein [candidate division KSB1 bacterium]|nr:metal ABC transporter ATP-binding protein [candidate division KSB1 bacterium]
MTTPVIDLQNVSVAYQDKIVLQDITLSVSPGAFLGILGPNGSGKTTLLRTMLGLTDPFDGTVRVFGKEPKKLKRLREKIGYVPQQSHIDLTFPIQVKDVVLLGRAYKMGLGKRPHNQDREAVEEALELVHMTDFADEQFGRLSGGQRQRVLIARALALQPDLLMLDEPTAALDVGAAESFYEWLHNTHKNLGLTLVLVTHDVGVVSRYVTAIACLNKRLVAHGLPENVLTEEGLQAMYGCDAVFFHHGKVPHLVVSTRDPEKT